jgi:hypothetical protein
VNKIKTPSRKRKSFVKKVERTLIMLQAQIKMKDTKALLVHTLKAYGGMKK